MRTIPAPIYTKLLELAVWQNAAPIDLTSDQIDACCVAESALLAEAGLEGSVWLRADGGLDYEDEDGKVELVSAV